MGSIGGFAGFIWGMVAFTIGGYQQFNKDRDFAQAVYTVQDKQTKFDQVEEE